MEPPRRGEVAVALFRYHPPYLGRSDSSEFQAHEYDVRSFARRTIQTQQLLSLIRFTLLRVRACRGTTQLDFILTKFE